MDKKLTVLVLTDIIPEDEKGGSGTVAWELSKNLQNRGHKVIIITKGKKENEKYEIIHSIEIFRYYSNPLKFLSIWQKIMSKYDVDILNFHSPYTSFWTTLLSPKIPSVYFFHSPWHEEYEIRCNDLQRGYLSNFFGAISRKKIEQTVLKSAKRILVASQFMQDKIKKYYKLDSLVIPYGVDIKKFLPSSDILSIRKKLNIPENKFVVLTLRNLVSRMGLEKLVAAMKEISRIDSNVYLIIGGTGYLKEKLEQQINDLSLQNFVRLEGYINDSDIEMYYQSADLFVLPTKLLEGFGLVTLESMSCGTPVVATPVAANLEVIGGFDNDHLFKGTEPQDISDGIINFIPKYLIQKDSIRKRCREFVEKNYSWDKYADEVEKIFYCVIGNCNWGL